MASVRPTDRGIICEMGLCCANKMQVRPLSYNLSLYTLEIYKYYYLAHSCLLFLRNLPLLANVRTSTFRWTGSFTRYRGRRHAILAPNVTTMFQPLKNMIKAVREHSGVYSMRIPCVVEWHPPFSESQRMPNRCFSRRSRPI